jgi:hypothetical protein
MLVVRLVQLLLVLMDGLILVVAEAAEVVKLEVVMVVLVL